MNQDRFPLGHKDISSLVLFLLILLLLAQFQKDIVLAPTNLEAFCIQRRAEPLWFSTLSTWLTSNNQKECNHFYFILLPGPFRVILQ